MCDIEGTIVGWKYAWLSTFCILRLPKQNKIQEVTHTKSQSYQTLISFFFRFSLLSLSVCDIWNWWNCFRTVKHNRKTKQKKQCPFYEEKSLVGSTLTVCYLNTTLTYKDPKVSVRDPKVNSNKIDIVSYFKKLPNCQKWGLERLSYINVSKWCFFNIPVITICKSSILRLRRRI